MSIDLSALSMTELKDLNKRLGKEIRVRTAREAKEAERAAAAKTKELFLQMRDMAAQHGLSIEEVVASSTRKRRTRGTAPVNRPKSPPKYRNPKDPEKTWTGKGRKPGWIVDALAKGKKLEDFAI